jgi:hypothetical protein
MKKSYLSIVFKAVMLLSLTVNSCVKESTDDLTYGIDPFLQKNLLCKSLRLIGNNIDGAMPVGTGAGLPISVSAPTVIEISAGVLLLLPYTVSDPNKICKIFLQVDSADNYWETKLVLDPSSKKPYFSILIPRFVHSGNFDLVFSLGDCNNNISRKYSTKTIVSPISDCNTSISGNYGITVRGFDLGDKAGKAGFTYDMYSIPDRLDIRYAGKWVASTGKLFDDNIVIPDCGNKSDGFVSGVGTLSFEFNPNVSRFVEVYVSGCNTGTKWDVDPNCP